MRLGLCRRDRNEDGEAEDGEAEERWPGYAGHLRRDDGSTWALTFCTTTSRGQATNRIIANTLRVSANRTMCAHQTSATGLRQLLQPEH
jgi:hypothetical protein